MVTVSATRLVVTLLPTWIFEDYDGEPIVLKWDTLYDAAADAGYSRLYGGIHIQDGDLRGREIGEAVGQAVVDTLL